MHRYIGAVFLTVVATQATEFLQCDGVRPPIHLSVDGCNKPPCKIIRGKEILAKIHFAVGSVATKLKPRVRVKIVRRWIEHHIGYEDACDYLTTGSCPLLPGDNAIYEIKFSIGKSTPRIRKSEVEMMLKNQDDQPMFCFRVITRVVG